MITIRCTRSRGPRGFRKQWLLPRPGERCRYPAWKMRFQINTLLIVITAISLTIAIGTFNYRAEQTDRAFDDQQCCTIRSTQYPWIVTLFFGNRLFNPVEELDLFALGMPQNEMRPGWYSAKLDSKLIENIRKLENLQTLWIYSEARNYSANTKTDAIELFPNIQIKELPSELPSPSRRIAPFFLPTYKWYNWLATFGGVATCLFALSRAYTRIAISNPLRNAG